MMTITMGTIALVTIALVTIALVTIALVTIKVRGEPRPDFRSATNGVQEEVVRWATALAYFPRSRQRRRANP
jgi:hypothetical protein